LARFQESLFEEILQEKGRNCNEAKALQINFASAATSYLGV